MSFTQKKLQHLSLGQFHALWDDKRNVPFHNPGRDDKESWGSPHMSIPQDMASGYDMSKGVMVSLPIERAAKLFGLKNPQKTVELQRQARIALLRQRATATNTYRVSNPEKPDEDIDLVITDGEVADFLEAVLEEKCTDIIVCGQRRTYAAPYTLALFARLHAGPVKKHLKKKEPTPNEVIAGAIELYKFDIEQRDVLSVAELDDMILRENSQNSKLDYSEVGKLRNAILVLNQRPTIGETDLGHLLSLGDQFGPNGEKIKNNRGLRQKIWRWAKVGMKHPALKLAERIGMEPEKYPDNWSPASLAGTVKYVKGGYIPTKRLDKEDAQSLLGDKQEPTAIVTEIIGSNQGNVQATTEQVESYVERVMTGLKPAGSLTKGEVKAYLDHPKLSTVSVPVADVLKAIWSGNHAFFTGLIAGGTRQDDTPTTEGSEGSDTEGSDTEGSDTPTPTTEGSDTPTPTKKGAKK
jgi:hypothetical protein